MARAADSAYELVPEDSPWRPYCLLVAGVARHLAGDRASAARRLEEGAAIAAATVPGIASLCLAQLALLSIEQDDWETAAEVADRGLAVAGSPGLVASPISALVFAAAAATEAHRGHVDAAKRDLRHGTELLAVLGDFIPWYGAETRIMLARAAVGLADTVRARTLLAEASRLARRTCGAVIFQHCFEQAGAQIDSLAEATLAGPSSLTIAELRILRFLPSHRSFREIAERLDVSVNTVKTQAHAIYRKLDAASRSEAVARASRAGLLGD
jgi:LuxR family maltose regulon positive regulatory protein